MTGTRLALAATAIAFCLGTSAASRTCTTDVVRQQTNPIYHDIPPLISQLNKGTLEKVAACLDGTAGPGSACSSTKFQATVGITRTRPKCSEMGDTMNSDVPARLCKQKMTVSTSGGASVSLAVNGCLANTCSTDSSDAATASCNAVVEMLNSTYGVANSLTCSGLTYSCGTYAQS